jgi:hypothetical protein
MSQVGRNAMGCLSSAIRVLNLWHRCHQTGQTKIRISPSIDSDTHIQDRLEYSQSLGKKVLGKVLLMHLLVIFLHGTSVVATTQCSLRSKPPSSTVAHFI